MLWKYIPSEVSIELFVFGKFIVQRFTQYSKQGICYDFFNEIINILEIKGLSGTWVMRCPSDPKHLNSAINKEEHVHAYNY